MSGPAEFRDFFAFDTPLLHGPVISAVLTLSSAGVSAVDSGSMTYQITSIPTVFRFNNLGTGTVYGRRVYTAADGANSPASPAGTNQSITLTPPASLLSFPIRHSASATGVCPTCIAQLQITTQAAVPEPKLMVWWRRDSPLLVLRRRAGRRSHGSG
jgi:hypothetical protein